MEQQGTRNEEVINDQQDIFDIAFWTFGTFRHYLYYARLQNALFFRRVYLSTRLEI